MAEAKSLRVLIADDEPLAAERLQLLLARADGAQLVGTASDGESAINLTKAVSPDLLLLDIAMPGLDGIGVARALTEQNPSPAVVFVTAFDQFAVAAFEVEAVDYLMKPVDPSRLQRALDRARTYLHQRSAEPAAGKASQWLEEFWASDLSGLVRIAAREGKTAAPLQEGTRRFKSASRRSDDQRGGIHHGHRAAAGGGDGGAIGRLGARDRSAAA